MAVEHEMLAGCPGIEGGDDVGHDLVGGDHPVLEPARLEKVADVARRLARIARRVGALAADKAAQEGDRRLALGVDRLAQLLPIIAHLACFLPHLFPAPAYVRLSSGIGLTT